jgi:hypothetical protein
MSQPAHVIPDSVVAADVPEDSTGLNDRVPHAALNTGCSLNRPHLTRDREFEGYMDSTPASSSRSGSRLDPRGPTCTEGHAARYDDAHSPYYGSRDSRNAAARSNSRRYDAHVPPYPRPWTLMLVRMTTKTISLKGASSYPHDIGTVDSWHRLLGIAPLMPPPSVAGNTTGTNVDITHLRLRL